MRITEIEECINELLTASRPRVKEIVSVLEGELSQREREFADNRVAGSRGDDLELKLDLADMAHECQYIPKARELLQKISIQNETGNSFIDAVSALKLAFVQIYDNGVARYIVPQ